MSETIQIIVAMTLAISWLFAFIMIVPRIADWIFDRDKRLEKRNKK